MSGEYDSVTGEPPADVASKLIDLTGMTLEDLKRIDQASLDLALSRVLARHEDPAYPLFAFQSCI